MAVGNTFGATALTSYGGFWIALAITFTPGGFKIETTLLEADKGSAGMFYDSLGLFLMVRHPWSPSIPITSYRVFLIGLVHIHLPHAAVHCQVDRDLLLPLRFRRSGIPSVGHWLYDPQ